MEHKPIIARSFARAIENASKKLNRLLIAEIAYSQDKADAPIGGKHKYQDNRKSNVCPANSKISRLRGKTIAQVRPVTRQIIVLEQAQEQFGAVLPGSGAQVHSESGAAQHRRHDDHRRDCRDWWHSLHSNGSESLP